MIPTFVWVYAVGDGWRAEVFTGEDRAEAAQKCADRILELKMHGQGLVFEPETYIAGINERKAKQT